MSTNLFKVYRSGGISKPRVAPAPSGGIYVAEGTSGGPDCSLARIDGSGFIWNKALYDADSWAAPMLASNATHVVLATLHTVPSTGTCYSLYDASGTLVWSTFLPEINALDDNYAVQYRAGILLLAADNSVFHFTGGVGITDSIISKLDGTTGNLLWAVNMRKSGATTGLDYTGSMTLLSGGDIVVHTRDSSIAYVQRLSGTDGSVTWSKGVVWTSAQLDTGVCADPSDNIYLVGRAHTSTTKVLPVVKLDSSGATLWNRNIECPSGLASLGLDFKWSGGLTADANGLYVACFLDGTSDNFMGHVFVPQAGTVATGTALVATFPTFGGPFDEIYSAAHAGGPSVFGFGDFTAPATGDYFGIIVTAGSSASEDGTWGVYDRVTYAFDVASGGATISTQTYTRASAPSLSNSSATLAESSGTLLVETYTPTYDATGLAPGTAFGTPRWSGYVEVGAYTMTTAFGDPRLRSDAFPTSVGPLTAFGTGAYSDDRSTTATGLAAGTTFGLAWAERAPLPGTPTTVAASPSTAFGRPTVNGAAAVTAEGASSTAFGTPVSGWVCPVTGFAVGAFGTPSLSIPVRATSVAPATAFGLGMTAGFGSTTGAAPSTAFGLPVATFGAVGVTTGSADTAFGTPSALNNRQRTRSGVFRTQWGLAQAERTAP